MFLEQCVVSGIGSSSIDVEERTGALRSRFWTKRVEDLTQIKSVTPRCPRSGRGGSTVSQDELRDEEQQQKPTVTHPPHGFQSEIPDARVLCGLVDE